MADPLIRGLTVRPPWSGAIAHANKRVENRSWLTYYRGLIAIHAATAIGPRYEWEPAAEQVAELADIPTRIVHEGMKVRSAVVAVARLADVCEASLRIPQRAALRCECGPWAVAQQRHFVLADVRALAVPVPCRGALGFWELPVEVHAAVVAQVPAVAGG